MAHIDWAILTRYANGTCSEVEKRAVRKWIEQEPENRRLVEELLRIGRISAVPPIEVPPPESYVADDWRRIKGILNVAPHAPSGSGALSDVRGRREHIDREARRDRPTRSDRVSASKRRNTRRARTQSRYALRISTVLVLLMGIAAAIILWNGRGGSGSPSMIAERVAATEAGERGRLTLSDGTQVELNVRSKLEYPRFFDSSSREVFLSGEAFFEVKSDPTRPFIVHASGATVRVRGTSFGVRAYDREEAVKVVVVEGLVDLTATGDESGRTRTVSLSRADLGQVVSGRIREVISNVDPLRHLGWQAGMLIFDDMPFEQVVEELENWYDLSIEIQDSTLARRPLTATFDNEAPELVLDVIAAALNAKYARSGPHVTFYLSGK